MTSTPFTRNYRDHSNNEGFQFEFFCDKCGSGFRSSFATNALGLASDLLKAAGSLFGGAVASAGWGADLVATLGLPGRLRDTSVSEAVLEAVANAALHDPLIASNPRPITSLAVIQQLLRDAW